ncbi:bifunctional helix-turn-helix transcriptional regulator/GNAT family N-acetyltransferase [Kiloniella antarctica]|uniref:GNAT family N-acetyltransferase n=1 Tax=Kiloniella antarctica TaxID=1550907 RepID=A0ABW5BIE3_9PROT
MNYLTSLGSLTLGSRLKRLSDTLFNEVNIIYEKTGVALQAGYFPLFYLLYKENSVSVTDCATALGVSHPAVSKMSRKMIEDGWVIKTPSPKDERTQLLTLSDQSRHALPKLVPIWDEIKRSLDRMLEEARGENLIEQLIAMEKENATISLSKKVLDNLADPYLSGDIEIVGWDAKYADTFKQLSKEWLDHYFPNLQEERDKESLDNPGGYYLARGGTIFFALTGGQPVGACALARESDDLYEISKVGVTPAAQSRGIGRKLVVAALNEARRLGAKQVFLESNRKLVNAQKIYRKLGFCDIPHPTGTSAYRRSNIYMIVTL